METKEFREWLGDMEQACYKAIDPEATCRERRMGERQMIALTTPGKLLAAAEYIWENLGEKLKNG